MLRKIILVSFLCFTFAGAVFAENLKVNNQPVNVGDNLNLFFENLEAGKINFSLEAGNLKKAEITFDKGRTWLEMEKNGDYFVYGYRPLANEVFFPEMILTDKDKGVQTYRPNLRINYQKEKPDQQLVQLLEKFKSFYENENKERFLNLFSTRFPNRVKFEQAIQNDFYNYKNMRLFYRIDTRAFDDDLEGAIWNVYWQRNYQDRDGNDLAESTANIAMRFDKEGGNWLITGLRNNTIFGSSLLGTRGTSTASASTPLPDLSIAISDITITYVGVYKVRVTANVHNIGDLGANNVKVKFYKKGPLDADYVDVANDQTIATILDNSSATASIVYDATAALGGNHTFKVVVDPFHTINESDETNNTAISAAHNIIP